MYSLKLPTMKFNLQKSYKHETKRKKGMNTKRMRKDRNNHRDGKNASR